jgi:hypothetical protein
MLRFGTLAVMMGLLACSSNGNPPSGNGNPPMVGGVPPSATNTDPLLGGWIDDTGWGTELPQAIAENIDFVNLGNITCVGTLRNGACNAPGPNSASNGPPEAFQRLSPDVCVSFLLGGAGCDASQWDTGAIVHAAGTGWCGIDVENECSMPTDSIGELIGDAQQRHTRVYATFAPGLDYSWVTSLDPAPDYYAMTLFDGAEWCGDQNKPSGCVPGPSEEGYDTAVPKLIESVLNAIGPGKSSQLILGIHSAGINAATVNFWCEMLQTYDLAGIGIFSMENIDATLFSQLLECTKPN